MTKICLSIKLYYAYWAMARDGRQVDQETYVFLSVGKCVEVYKRAYAEGKGITGNILANTLHCDFGKRIYFTKASETNMKVTTPEDILRMEVFLAISEKHRSKRAHMNNKEKSPAGFTGRALFCTYNFFIFILRAARVSASMMIYRQPMVIKIADQPKVSFTKPKTEACTAAPI